MIPIERRVSQQSCDTATASDCDFNDPWWDETIFQFQVPPVGETTTIQVCNPERYAVGQWVYIQGAGRFYITAIDGSSQTLTIRNSCVDGTTAVDGNAVPGTAFPEGTQLWVIDEPAWPYCIGDELCTSVATCISELEEICFTNLSVADEETEHHLFGGDSPEQSCFKKLPNVNYKGGALCYSARSTVNGSKSGAPATSKKFVVNDPDGGCDKPLALPSETAADGMYRYCDGDITFISDGRFFVMGSNQAIDERTISVAGGNQSYSFAAPTAPAGCAGKNPIALLHVRGTIATSVSADYFDYELDIEGQDCLKLQGNELFNVPNSPVPAHNDVLIPVEITGANISVDLREISPAAAGSSGTFSIWIRGWFV